MKRATLTVAALVSIPDVAAACATCIGSAYGDRSYNVAYIGLILTPFAVALTVGAIITRSWWTHRRDDVLPVEPQFNERREDAPERCVDDRAPVGCADAPVEKT
jgi:hypothetical protein